ncbi:MAG: nudG, partial [Verrucomicrobiales bacterium]|nr:nudG [Verrucomicrobiales bacterium]
MNVIEVAAGLVFHGGKLLITQRFQAAHLGGLWEFPGGKREADESFENCLIRELREELGIEVIVGSVIEDLTHQYPEKKVRLRFFLCGLKRNSPMPSPIGCAAVAWVTSTELGGYVFPGADE